MKKLFVAMLCLFVSVVALAQKSFKIKGKIDRLSKSNTIIVAGLGQFSAPINPDGTFEISGNIPESGTALVKSDSSAAYAIWLEPGNYNISCKEIVMSGVGGYLLRIPELKGPKDAEVDHGYHQLMFSANTGSTPEERLQKRKEDIIHFIDSILKYFPGSMALPNIIRLSHGYLGDDTTAFYKSLPSADQKSDPNYKTLDNYFKRKEKIEKEKLFEDFEMKTNEDKSFRLSSIRSKKLVLIDFWASDCFPCRARHKELAELYEQYSSKGLEIVSVSLDDNKTEWLQAIKTDKMNWINVSDLKGWDTPLAVNYFVELIPYALWIDGDRKIIGSDLDEKQIAEYLK